MVNTLSGSVSAYRQESVKQRFIRIDEAMALLNVTRDETRISIVQERLDITTEYSVTDLQSSLHCRVSVGSKITGHVPGG